MSGVKDHQPALGIHVEARVIVIVFFKSLMQNVCFCFGRAMVIHCNDDVAGTVDPPGVGPLFRAFVKDRPRIGEPAPGAVGSERLV